MGAWIETRISTETEKAQKKSHPMWVRGLKHLIIIMNNYVYTVASYVGAWIETMSPVDTDSVSLSHPMWVRGLKQMKSRFITGGDSGRILCGCVD